jgi:hypothetical protein
MCSRGGGISLLLWSALVLHASAHSFLLAPKGDWTDYNQPECRMGGTNGYARNCWGPCGVDGNFFNPDQQPVTYSRGQYVNMQWAKNNHFSGFVRFTLVPKRSRMDFSKHEKFAFRYACWEAGKAPCGSGEFCGTDMEGFKYTANVQIPPVYPDGEYVLGWSWYGGSKFFPSNELKSSYGIDGESGHRSEYGDYFSCANVRIQGGMAVQDEYKPIFETGQADRTGNDGGTCASAVNKLDKCKTEPCSAKYPVTNRVPAEFDGRSPPPIKSSDLRRNVQGSGKLGSKATPSIGPTPQPNSTNTSTSAPEANDEPSVTSTPNSPAGSSAQNGDNQGSSSQNGNNPGSSSPNGGNHSSSPPTDFVSFDFISTNNQSVIYSTNADSGAYVTLMVKNMNEHISLRANTTGSVRDVQFIAKLKNNQAEVLNHKEDTPPFFIAGDENGNGIANAWQNVPVDNWIDISVTVTSTSGNQKSKELYLYLDTSQSRRRR